MLLDVAFTALLGTDAPLDVGAGLAVEAPHRLRAQTTVGIMPGVYVDGINEILVGFGAYDQATADLVHDALKNSLIWRTSLGWRPWERHGFYALAGYTLVTLGGGATGSEIIEAATGKELPPSDRGMPRSFTCNSTLHMATVELGWEFHTGPVVIRTALGGVFTFAAHTTITPDYTPAAPKPTADFAAAGAQYLDDIYTSYVFSPVATVMVGYPF